MATKSAVCVKNIVMPTQKSSKFKSFGKLKITCLEKLSLAQFEFSFANKGVGNSLSSQWRGGGARERLTGSRSGARGLGDLLNGGGAVHEAGIQSEIGEVREERGVLEVDLHTATACGPLRGVEDAGVHAHGLPAQVRVPMRFVVLEHPDQHVVHVHTATHHKNMYASRSPSIQTPKMSYIRLGRGHKKTCSRLLCQPLLPTSNSSLPINTWLDLSSCTNWWPLLQQSTLTAC